jgi:hypothetical protein
MSVAPQAGQVMPRLVITTLTGSGPSITTAPSAPVTVMGAASARAGLWPLQRRG